MKNIFTGIGGWVITAAYIGIGISYSNLYLFHIIALAFVVFGLISHRYILKNIVNTPLYAQPEIFPALMLLLYLVSLIWSDDKMLALYYNFYWICGLIILAAFRFSITHLQSQYYLLRTLGILAGIEILLALLEFYTPVRFPVSPYSDYVHWFGREQAFDPNLPAEVIATIKQTPTGFRWNPNNLAVLMLIVIPFFLFARQWWLKLAGAASGIFVIVLTGSRGALVALALMAGIYFLFFINLRTRLILLGLGGLIVLAVSLNLDYLKSNYEVKYREISTTALALNNYLFVNHEEINDTSSIAIRQNLIRNGIGAFKQSYGGGVGAGNSQHVQMQQNNTHSEFSMHNFWVEVLVEGGIIAFLLWLSFYLYLIYGLIRVIRQPALRKFHFFAKSCILAMAGMAVGMISISSAVYYFPMWILLGLSIATIRNARSALSS